jgi:hypothetical protein
MAVFAFGAPESFLDSAGKMPADPTDKMFVPRVRPTDRIRDFQ